MYGGHTYHLVGKVALASIPGGLGIEARVA